MNMNTFTQRSADALNYAQQMAQAESHPQVTPMHLLMALLRQDEGLVGQVLKKIGADIDGLKNKVDDQLKLFAHQEGGQLYASNELAQVLDKAEGEAAKLKD